MRDPEEKITIVKGDTTHLTRYKNVRYEILISELETQVAKLCTPHNRSVFHQLAWCLGLADQEEACEAIMKAAVEPPPPVTNPWGMYGGYVP